MNQKAIEETVREVLRIAVLGAVAGLVSWATTKVAGLDPNSVYAIVGTIVLRAADKYVHANPTNGKQGILPFQEGHMKSFGWVVLAVIVALFLAKFFGII